MGSIMNVTTTTFFSKLKSHVLYWLTLHYTTTELQQLKAYVTVWTKTKIQSHKFDDENELMNHSVRGRCLLSPFISLYIYIYIYIYMKIDHHHLSVMELGHLLTRSGLTCPEASSKVCHNSFCQLRNSVSLSWVFCYEAFCLHVVSISSCIPVICLEMVLFLIPL